MKTLYKKGLFIFRRDLRIDDNTGLIHALSVCQNVLPCFIINPKQVGQTNSYRSLYAIQFMVESLKELAQDFEQRGGRLFLFFGDPEDIVEKLIPQEQIDALFFNEDYTPYSRHRDTLLEEICKKFTIPCLRSFDSLLIKPQEGLTDKGTPYKVFTPFYLKNSQIPVAKPTVCRMNSSITKVTTETKDLSFLDQLYTPNPHQQSQGGRKAGRAILDQCSQFSKYAATRDLVSLHTTHLSAHNKFGTLSIREVAHALQEHLSPTHGLVRQLYWRDFFHHIAWYYPHVFGSSFHTIYDRLEWNTNTHDFARWCEGTTGFPLVDAGMRQLNETGFMHNRARLVVGSFLTKDLHINWLWGEKYFAQHLIDYDPCVNNGNWQWVASTGCDAQPYFRIFNPWLQQKKFDPDCTYIKRWIPELRSVPSNIIHTWYKQKSTTYGYPVPLVNHEQESARAKELYKNVASLKD